MAEPSPGGWGCRGGPAQPHAAAPGAAGAAAVALHKVAPWPAGNPPAVTAPQPTSNCPTGNSPTGSSPSLKAEAETCTKLASLLLVGSVQRGREQPFGQRQRGAGSGGERGCGAQPRPLQACPGTGIRTLYKRKSVVIFSIQHQKLELFPVHGIASKPTLPSTTAAVPTCTPGVQKLFV